MWSRPGRDGVYCMVSTSVLCNRSDRSPMQSSV